MTHRNQRRSIFIDRPVQLALLFRAALYLAVSLMAQLLMMFFFAFVTSSQDDFVTNSPQLWWHLQVSAIAWLVLVPIILLDLLKLSHRWVGPMVRMRNSLHSLSRGESIPPVQFRTYDFWQELGSDLNGIAAKLDRHKSALPKEEVVKFPLLAREALPGPEFKSTSSAI